MKVSSAGHALLEYIPRKFITVGCEQSHFAVQNIFESASISLISIILKSMIKNQSYHLTSHLQKLGLIQKDKEDQYHLINV